LSDMPVETALKIVLFITMSAVKEFDPTVAMVEPNVELEIDLIVERSGAIGVVAREQTMMNFRGMFGRDVLLLEGNGTNGTRKLSLLRDGVVVVRTAYLLRFRTFLKVTSLAFGASNLFNLSVFRLLVTVDVSFPPKNFFALVTRKNEALLVNRLHMSIQICLRFEGESALVAGVGSDVLVDGLDVPSQQPRLAEGASAFVALKLALFLVNRPHVHAHVMLAREPFIAVGTGKHLCFRFRFRFRFRVSK